MKNKTWFTVWTIARIGRIVLSAQLAVLFTALLLILLGLDPSSLKTSYWD